MNTPLKKTLKNLKFAHTHLVTCQMWSHLHTVTSNNPIPLPLLPQHTHLCVTNQNSVSLFTIPSALSLCVFSSFFCHVRRLSPPSGRVCV